MLPDFVSIKTRRHQWFVRLIKRKVKEIEPILGQLKPIRQWEGKQLIAQTMQGDEYVVNYDQKFESELRIQFAEFPDLDNARYQEKAINMAEEMASQEMKRFFATLDESIERGGQKINAKGQPFKYC